MIKFFKKARKQLLTENKFTKYLIYALGEIILVIIGILIALQINNKNEANKIENVFRSNLLQVHEELKINIENTTNSIFAYIEKDSLFGAAMSDTLIAEDFKTPDGYYLSNIGFKVEQTTLFNSSFANLNRNIEILPEKYNPILKLLDKVYLEKAQEVFAWNKIMMQQISENESKIKNEQKWFSLYLKNDEVNDEAISFFLHDPFYKNQIAHYYKNSRNHFNRIKTYRVEAIKSFNSIADLLMLKDNNISDSLNFNIRSEILRCYVGKYSKKEWNYTSEISLENSRLFMLIDQGNGGSFKSEMFPLTKTEFFILDDDLIIDLKNENNCQVPSLTWNILGAKYLFKRVE